MCVCVLTFTALFGSDMTKFYVTFCVGTVNVNYFYIYISDMKKMGKKRICYLNWQFWIWKLIVNCWAIRLGRVNHTTHRPAATTAPWCIVPLNQEAVMNGDPVQESPLKPSVAPRVFCFPYRNPLNPPPKPYSSLVGTRFSLSTHSLAQRARRLFALWARIWGE